MYTNDMILQVYWKIGGFRPLRTYFEASSDFTKFTMLCGGCCGGCDIQNYTVVLSSTPSEYDYDYSMSMVWKVQPSKANSCHSRAMIDEVVRVSGSPQHITHLRHVWDHLLDQHRHWYKGPLI